MVIHKLARRALTVAVAAVALLLALATPSSAGGDPFPLTFQGLHKIPDDKDKLAELYSDTEVPGLAAKIGVGWTNKPDAKYASEGYTAVAPLDGCVLVIRDVSNGAQGLYDVAALSRYSDIVSVFMMRLDTGRIAALAQTLRTVCAEESSGQLGPAPMPAPSGKTSPVPVPTIPPWDLPGSEQSV
jgi:hypothetical protein